MDVNISFPRSFNDLYANSANQISILARELFKTDVQKAKSSNYLAGISNFSR